MRSGHFEAVVFSLAAGDIKIFGKDNLGRSQIWFARCTGNSLGLDGLDTAFSNVRILYQLFP